MRHHALITPLRAIRMLMDGSGVLVRAERWAEVQQEIDHWRAMYQQCHEQRAEWYERCQDAERRAQGAMSDDEPLTR